MLIWNEAKRHHDEPVLAALLLAIATVNVWNRVNVSTRQVAGTWQRTVVRHGSITRVKYTCK